MEVAVWDEQACRDAARLRRQGPGEDVVRSVRAILDDVAARKDAALLELTQRFDGASGPGFTLEAGPEEFEAAYKAVDGPVLAAIRRAISRVRVFQEENLWVGHCAGNRAGDRPPDRSRAGESDRAAALEARPLDRVGIYIPGGRAAYPSSVVMTAIPARVAGVGEVVVCTPPGKDGRLPAPVLVACRECGVDRVFKVGGAQAVAGMAYGTETIPAVDKIVGPGNAYVTEAKRQVFGLVGIDSLAGPSEVLILAGPGADAEMVATDLLAQAEHGPGALGLLVTWDGGLASAVGAAVTRLTAGVEREIGREVEREVKGQVALCTVGFPEAAVGLSAAWNAEHVQVLSPLPGDLLHSVRGAALFLGPSTAVAFGDYIAGPSHVLPTMGAARFAGPLSANDFFRTFSRLELDAAAAAGLSADTALLAGVEGLPWHARSATRRGGW